MHVDETTESDDGAIGDNDWTAGDDCRVMGEHVEEIGSDGAEDEEFEEKLSAKGLDVSFVATGILFMNGWEWSGSIEEELSLFLVDDPLGASQVSHLYF